MYEEFYGFKEKPFSLTPDPKFLYLSTQHREVMEHLNFGILQKEGFILITGEVGTGKTTICRALINRLREKTPIALLLNPFASEEELLRYILTDFGLTPFGQTRLELIEELNRFLLDNIAKGGICVLVIDEAQNLSFSILEQIRILSNLETEKAKLLQIVLVGQEELREKLKLPKLRQLDQRVSVRYHLRPLSKEDTAKYIHHRLAVAGSHGKALFGDGAIREIYRFSQGTPRLVNLLCDRALLNGFVKGKQRITTSMIREAEETLKDERKSFLKPWGWKWAIPLAAVIFLLTSLFAVFDPGGMIKSVKTSFLGGEASGSRGSSGKAASSASAQPPPKMAAFVYDRNFPYTVHIGSYATEEEALEATRTLIPKSVTANDYSLVTFRRIEITYLLMFMGVIMGIAAIAGLLKLKSGKFAVLCVLALVLNVGLGLLVHAELERSAITENSLQKALKSQDLPALRSMC